MAYGLKVSSCDPLSFTYTSFKLLLNKKYKVYFDSNDVILFKI